MMDDKNKALAQECKRLSESCQYTSASIYMWLRYLRWIKAIFTAVPLILGSLSSWQLLTSSDIEAVRNLIAIFAFLAGLLPSIYAALKFDERLGQYVSASGNYKNLEHKFRKLALVDSNKEYEDFEEEFDRAMQDYEQQNALSLTVPEWCFKRAQRKVQSGDYDFDSDQSEK